MIRVTGVSSFAGLHAETGRNACMTEAVARNDCCIEPAAARSNSLRRNRHKHALRSVLPLGRVELPACSPSAPIPPRWLRRRCNNLFFKVVAVCRKFDSDLALLQLLTCIAQASASR